MLRTDGRKSLCLILDRHYISHYTSLTLLGTAIVTLLVTTLGTTLWTVGTVGNTLYTTQIEKAHTNS